LQSESPQEHLPGSIAGVPSATLGTGSSTPRLRPFVSDRSAKRFAQDDDFVWGLAIQMLGPARSTKDLKSHSLQDDKGEDDCSRKVVAGVKAFLHHLGGIGKTHLRFVPDSAKAIVGLRPSFSAHVRFGEHGAPVRFPPGSLNVPSPRPISSGFFECSESPSDFLRGL
jgi:hypothetical protein